MPASAHLYSLLNNKVLPVTIMIMYSTVYMLWTRPRHEGLLFVLAEMQAQNALEQLDWDLTYGSLKSY